MRVAAELEISNSFYFISLLQVICSKSLFGAWLSDLLSFFIPGIYFVFYYCEHCVDIYSLTLFFFILKNRYSPFWGFDSYRRIWI
ncbi:UNVERIFIED_ORG: hypothetical protein DFS12_10262 [Chitinophaga ginsengisegetis]|nr:hypothetical protein [Chitinophaga ginsengisegetis]MDR6647175.1 hypothetical protein [Chitinophaga ginsengisegetis]MDR6653524.1 hypothetical protein [Chitinophaga ginsengisegetis]